MEFGYFRKNGMLLSFLYFCTFIWGITAYVVHEGAVVPPVTLIYLFYPYALLAVAILLFVREKKWLSETKIASILFVLPFIYVVIIPEIKQEISLRTAIPTVQQLEQFYDHSYFDHSIDFTPARMMAYDERTKLLTVRLRIESGKFIDELSTLSKPVSQQRFAETYMFGLYKNYIGVMTEFGSISLVPQEIVCEAYWNDQLLFRTHFYKRGRHYELAKPYPYLVLKSQRRQWQLEYDNQGKKEHFIVLRDIKSNDDIYESLENVIIEQQNIESKE